MTSGITVSDDSDIQILSHHIVTPTQSNTHIVNEVTISQRPVTSSHTAGHN